MAPEEWQVGRRAAVNADSLVGYIGRQKMQTRMFIQFQALI